MWDYKWLNGFKKKKKKQVWKPNVFRRKYIFINNYENYTRNLETNRTFSTLAYKALKESLVLFFFSWLFIIYYVHVYYTILTAVGFYQNDLNL